MLVVGGVGLLFHFPFASETYQTLLIETVFKKLSLGFSAVSLLHQPPLRSGRWRESGGDAGW